MQGERELWEEPIQISTMICFYSINYSNKDPVTQKYELQQVYEWFSLNKPLIKSKTKPSQRKPKVSITKCDSIDPDSFSFSEVERPQTAPPSLNKVLASIYIKYGSSSYTGS